MWKYINSLLAISIVLSFSGCTQAMYNQIHDLQSLANDATGVKDNALYEESIFLRPNPDAHLNHTTSIALSNDKSMLISTGGDGNIKIWDIKSQKLIKKIPGYIGSAGDTGKIYALALSRDNKYMAVGGYFGRTANSRREESEDIKSVGLIRVYDFRTGEIVKTLRDHNNAILDLKFSPDGKVLLSYGTDSKLNIWDINDNFSLQRTISTKQLIYHGKSKIDILSNNDNEIILYPTQSLAQVFKYSLKNNSAKVISEYSLVQKLSDKKHWTTSVDTLKFFTHFSNPSEQLIALSDTVGDIYIYDINFKLIQKIKMQAPDEQYIYQISFLENGKYLLSSVNDTIYVYDWKNSNVPITSYTNKSSGGILDFLALDNETLVVGTKDIDIQKLNPLNKQDTFAKGNDIIYQVGINGNKIAYGTKQYSDSTLIKYNDRAPITHFFNIQDKRISEIVNLKEFQTIPNQESDFKLKLSPNRKVLFVEKDNLEISKIHFRNIYGSTSDNQHTAFGVYKDFVITVTGSALHAFHISNGDYSKATFLGHSGPITSFAIQDDKLISGSTDGMIKIWNLKELNNQSDKEIFPKSLASLYIANNIDWVMWTQEGYFDASENGHKYFGFHINKGPEKNAVWIDADKLYDHFFRPDLVKLKLQGEDINKYTGGVTYKEVLKNLPPTVSIASVNGSAMSAADKKATLATPTAKISFNVTENNGGSGIIRIYQEGKLVKTIGSGQVNRQSADADVKAQEAQIDKKSKEAQTIYLAKVEDTVTKSLGREFNANELVETVNIDNGSAVSTKGTHTIELPLKAGNNTISIEAFNKTNTVASYRDSVNINASIKPKAPKIYAIALGVNKFEQSSVSPLKYSENDAKVIAEKIKKATSYQTDVTLLTGTNMTKENIQKALQSIKAKAGLEDKVIFYVSTHGKAVNGNLFLVPQNNKSVKNWINFEELFKEVQSISALDQIFVIDACESGKASDIMASVYDAKTSVLAKQSGVHVLMATTKGTFAFEHPDKNVQHGVFTYNILKALDDPKTDKNADKWISVVELSKTLQEPANNAEHQFPIIRNVGQDTQIRNLK